ncbi:MAG: DinB family protein [Planctomycetota bacterium]|nr:DinB family protein [Planctomycetota bacterium]
MRERLIEYFATGGELLAAAVTGLEPQDVVRRVSPGTWSILELVVHIADGDAVVIGRMKRILTEENPTLPAFDQDAHIARLHCNEQSLEETVQLIDLNRRQFAHVLRRLTPAEFDRQGTHSTAGIVTVGSLLDKYSDHLGYHLGFLAGKRKTIGKPFVARPTPWHERLAARFA